MWCRAFTILFELRARVSTNLKTTIDINEYLGIRPGNTVTINYNSDCSDDNYPKRAYNQQKQIDRQKAKEKDMPKFKMEDKNKMTSKIKKFEERLKKEKKEAKVKTPPSN